jgi:hypothetical protein
MMGWDFKGKAMENRNGYLVELRRVEKVYAGAAG